VCTAMLMLLTNKYLNLTLFFSINVFTVSEETLWSLFVGSNALLVAVQGGRRRRQRGTWTSNVKTTDEDAAKEPWVRIQGTVRDNVTY